MYTITDVPDLCDWMKKHFTEHPLFEEVIEDELVKNAFCIYNLGQKTSRRSKWGRERSGTSQ